MILSDLAKYSMTPSIARPLCDSRATCFFITLGWVVHGYWLVFIFSGCEWLWASATDPDDVPHCLILSPDKTEWRLISATLCRWRRCFVADQLWFMTCIREEEEVALGEPRFQWHAIIRRWISQKWYKIDSWLLQTTNIQLYSPNGGNGGRLNDKI